MLIIFFHYSFFEPLKAGCKFFYCGSKNSQNLDLNYLELFNVAVLIVLTGMVYLLVEIGIQRFNQRLKRDYFSFVEPMQILSFIACTTERAN